MELFKTLFDSLFLATANSSAGITSGFGDHMPVLFKSAYIFSRVIALPHSTLELHVFSFLQSPAT